MFRPKGSLLPGLLLGILGLGLGIWAATSGLYNPGAESFGPPQFLGVMVVLFSVWVLAGVLLTYLKRRG